MHGIFNALLLIILFEVNVYAVRYCNRINTVYKDKSICFSCIDTMKKEFLANGFTALEENERWSLKAGGQYFVTRNDSSIIAFSIPENGFDGMRIMASHSDSPSFKIKENPEIEVEKQYIKLNVERYGGMIFAPWFDRPLSVAGRLILKILPPGNWKVNWSM